MALLNRDSLTAQIPRLYRVALRIVGNHHSAEEIVQEVCVKVLEQKEGFRLNGEAQPTTWLHRVTVNCALDRVRRGGKQTVKVMHIHQHVAVESGAQAVVAGGNVKGGYGAKKHLRRSTRAGSGGGLKRQKRTGGRVRNGV